MANEGNSSSLSPINDRREPVESNGNNKKNGNGKKRSNNDDEESKDQKKSNSDNKKKDLKDGDNPAPAKKTRVVDDTIIHCHQDRKNYDKAAGNYLQCTSESTSRKKGSCTLSYCTKCLHEKYQEEVDEIKSKGKASTWTCPACRGLCICGPCRKKSTGFTTGVPPTEASTSASTSKGKNGNSNSTTSAIGSTSKLTSNDMDIDSDSSLSDVESLVSVESYDTETGKAKPKKVVKVVKPKSDKPPRKRAPKVKPVEAVASGSNDKKPVVTKSNGTASTSALPDQPVGPVVKKRMAPRGPNVISAPAASIITTTLPTSAFISCLHIREFILRFVKFMPSLAPLPEPKVDKKKKKNGGRNTRANRSAGGRGGNNGGLTNAALKARETRRLTILKNLEDFEYFWSREGDLDQRAILLGLFELISGPNMAYHERDVLVSQDALTSFRALYKTLKEVGPDRTSQDQSNKPWVDLIEFLELQGWQWELEPELVGVEEFGRNAFDNDGVLGRSSTRSGKIEVNPIERLRMILALIDGAYQATLVRKDIVDGNEADSKSRADLNRRKFKILGQLRDGKSTLNQSKPIRPKEAVAGTPAGDKLLAEYKAEISAIDEKIHKLERIKHRQGCKVQQELYEMSSANKSRFGSIGKDLDGRTYYLLSPTPELSFPLIKPKVQKNEIEEDDEEIDELDEIDEDEETHPLSFSVLVYGNAFPKPLPPVVPTIKETTPAITNTTGNASISKSASPALSNAGSTTSSKVGGPSTGAAVLLPKAPAQVLVHPKFDQVQNDNWYTITVPQEMIQLSTYIDYTVKYFKFEQKLAAHYHLYPPSTTSRSGRKSDLPIIAAKKEGNAEFEEAEPISVIELQSELITFEKYIEACREEVIGAVGEEESDDEEELTEIESSSDEKKNKMEVESEDELEEDHEEDEASEEEVESEPEFGQKRSTRNLRPEPPAKLSRAAKGKAKARISNSSRVVEDDEEEESELSDQEDDDDEEVSVQSTSTSRTRTKIQSKPKPSTSKPYKKLGKMVVQDDEEDELDELVDDSEEEAIESGAESGDGEDDEEEEEEGADESGYKSGSEEL